jgi:hypothetical protein
MRFEHQATPVHVDERTALASVDLLSSIVAAWPALAGGKGSARMVIYRPCSLRVFLASNTI